jgi:hypothetical protein
VVSVVTNVYVSRMCELVGAASSYFGSVGSNG